MNKNMYLLVRFGKMILNSIVIIVISGLIGLGLLLASFSLPNDRIQKSVAGSTWMLNAEGLYPERIHGLNSTKMDNWTDALMMNNLSFYDEDISLIEQTLRVPRAESRNNPIYSLHTYYHEDDIKVNVETYERYWHGYIVFLRPLFMIGDYSIVRFLYFILHICLLLIMLRLIENKIGKYPAIAFLATYLCFTGFVTPFSLQYSTIMFILLISGIVTVIFNDWLIHNNRVDYYYLLLGIVTVYFDYLTYPITVLGMNMILYLLLNKERKTLFSELLYCVLMWFVGYGGMWAMKWLLSSFILKENVFLNVFDAIRERAGNTGMGIDLTPALVIKNNLKYLVNKPVIFIMIITFVISMVSMCAFRTKKLCVFNCSIKKLCSIILIALLPFVWISVLLNHSFVHEYFTFRSFMPTIFALLILPEYLVSESTNKKQW